MGTMGEIKGNLEKNEIEINYFHTGVKEVVNIKSSSDGHGGGDSGIMSKFVELVQADNGVKELTSADKSVQSHVMAFAAEKSRLEDKDKKIQRVLEWLPLKK